MPPIGMPIGMPPICAPYIGIPPIGMPRIGAPYIAMLRLAREGEFVCSKAVS